MIRAGLLSMNWLGIEMMYNGNGKGFRIDRRSSKNVQRPYEHILIGSGNRTTRAFSVLVENPRLISHGFDLSASLTCISSGCGSSLSNTFIIRRSVCLSGLLHICSIWPPSASEYSECSHYHLDDFDSKGRYWFTGGMTTPEVSAVRWSPFPRYVLPASCLCLLGPYAIQDITKLLL